MTEQTEDGFNTPVDEAIASPERQMPRTTRSPRAEVQRHWDRVRALGCIITHRPEPTLHHCKGGSMLEVIGLHGAALKVSDWLVIPLDQEFHTGDHGVERGVKSWEARFGRQVDLLDLVCRRLGYNIWTLAGIDRNAQHRYTLRCF